MAQINQQLTPSANITTPPSGFMAQFFNQSGELSFKDENGNVITPSAQISSSYATTSSYAFYALSASYEINYETSSSYADFAKTASYVALAEQAKGAFTASYVANAVKTISSTTDSLIVTQMDGDQSLISIDVSFAPQALSSSYATTASYVNTAIGLNEILPLNFANDASASAAGVPIGGLYRNGNVVSIRIN